MYLEIEMGIMFLLSVLRGRLKCYISFSFMESLFQTLYVFFFETCMFTYAYLL